MKNMQEETVSVFERGLYLKFSCIPKPWKRSIDLENTRKTPGTLP